MKPLPDENIFEMSALGVPDYIDYTSSMCADDGFGTLVKLPYPQLVTRLTFFEIIS